MVDLVSALEVQGLPLETDQELADVFQALLSDVEAWVNNITTNIIIL